MSVIAAALSALAWPVVHAFVLFLCFLAFLTVYKAHLSGNLAKAAPFVRAVCWVIVSIGYTVDVTFNWTFACLILWELPRHDTFTRRCASHLEEPGWRGNFCRGVCRQLDLFQEGGHCKRRSGGEAP